MGLGIKEPLGGVELEYVGTTLPVGFSTGDRVTGKDGAVYRLVKNALGGSATIRLAYFLRVNATSGELECKAAGDDASAGAVCIPQFATVADGSYFWVGTGGFLRATSAAAIAANAQVSLSTTDGKLDDAAITGKFLNAFLNSSAAVTAADVNIGIYCPSELYYAASN
ncbi:MAG: hypothetical protein ACO3S8_00740 [Aquiluna sp.]